MPTPFTTRIRAIFLFSLFYFLFALTGCATHGTDPFEKSNRAIYDLNDNLDKYALKPLADGYTQVIPKPVRDSLGHAFDNMGYANVIINDFLQANWNQGWSDSGRMALNSTVGIGGFLDVATPCGLVSHDNDLGITLGKWGVEPGPYLVLPFFGPSTPRDAPGIVMEIATQPIVYLDIPIGAQLAIGTVQAVDARSRYSAGIRFRDQTAIDSYIFTREAYLQFRDSQIHNTHPKPPDESFYNDDTTATAPATKP